MLGEIFIISYYCFIQHDSISFDPFKVKFYVIEAKTHSFFSNSKEPSNYLNIPSSYQHLSKMIFVDVLNVGSGVFTLRGYISYFGMENQLVFSQSVIFSS